MKQVKEVLLGLVAGRYSVNESYRLITDCMNSVIGNARIDEFSHIRSKAERWYRRCNRDRKCTLCGRQLSDDYKTCRACREYRYNSKRKVMVALKKRGICRLCRKRKVFKPRSLVHCKPCLIRYRAYRAKHSPITHEQISTFDHNNVKILKN